MSAPSDLKKIALELLEKCRDLQSIMGGNGVLYRGVENEAEYADYKARIEACEPEARNGAEVPTSEIIEIVKKQRANVEPIPAERVWPQPEAGT